LEGLDVTERSSWRDQSVFVTGASGVVGSALVHALLEDGARVVALIRDEHPDSELVRSGDDRRVVGVRGNLHEGATLQRALVQYEVDVVFHLGAQTQVRHAQRSPFDTLESNVRGTYQLLEAIRGLVRPVRATVVASSDKAYGSSSTLPYTEDHPLQGRNVYDASKSAADLIASSYSTGFELPLGIARCGNIYGPGDLNWDRIVPGTIRSLIRGERPVIRSDGTLRRDYLHVDDAVRAYLALAQALLAGRQRGEAFNFGHGRPVSVIALVDAIASAVGRTDLAPDIRGEAPNEIPAQWLDAGKAKARLGWTPDVSLADGLARTVPWYRDTLSGR
jgi:CDP-glucose 4,6-dehydratase